MDISQIINRFKNRILSIIIFAIFLIVAYNIYKAHTKTMVSLNQKKEYKQVYPELEENKDSILKEISALDARHAKLKNFINTKDVELIINKLGSIAKQSSVKIISIKPEEQFNATAYSTYPFRLSISSTDYHNVGKFVRNLENSPDVYFVDDLTLRSVSTPDGRDTKLEVDLIISTILIKD